MEAHPVFGKREVSTSNLEHRLTIASAGQVTEKSMASHSLSQIAEIVLYVIMVSTVCC